MKMWLDIPIGLPLLIIVSTFFPIAAEEEKNCPTEKDLNITNPSTDCKCYSVIKYLVCRNKVQDFSIRKMYKFKSIDSTSSQDSEDELVDSSESAKLQIQSLDILQEGSRKTKLDNIDDLVRLPTEMIKIESNLSFEQTIDLSQLKTDLRSISLNQIRLLKHNFVDSYFDKFAHLRHLELVDIKFDNQLNVAKFFNSPLALLELIDTNIEGEFAFTPDSCPDSDGRILIKLHNNKLKSFNFSSLFANTSAQCHFHIDLAQMDGLDADFLDKQTEIIKQNHGKIYLLLRDVKMNCGCNLYKLYNEKDGQKSFSGYIHSVVCDNLEQKPLDEVNDSDNLCNNHV